tara:strand:+ start:932 stop:1285 length:354 start_codon:yes stop_codon:yes gene_type:complete
MSKIKSTKHIANQISQLMLEKKASDIKIIDVRKITTLTDFFIICSSDSEPKTKAIASYISETLKNNDIRPLHIEGYNYLDWVLLDYVNIVAHIFSNKSREFYNFEGLWADAEVKSIK